MIDADTSFLSNLKHTCTPKAVTSPASAQSLMAMERALGVRCFCRGPADHAICPLHNPRELGEHLERLRQEQEKVKQEAAEASTDLEESAGELEHAIIVLQAIVANLRKHHDASCPACVAIKEKLDELAQSLKGDHP